MFIYSDGGDAQDCGTSIEGPVCRTLSYAITVNVVYYKIVSNIDIDTTNKFTISMKTFY